MNVKYIDPFSHPDDKNKEAVAMPSEEPEETEDFITDLPKGWVAYHIDDRIEVFNGAYRVEIHDGDARVYKPVGKTVLRNAEEDDRSQILEAIRFVEEVIKEKA